MSESTKDVLFLILLVLLVIVSVSVFRRFDNRRLGDAGVWATGSFIWLVNYLHNGGVFKLVLMGLFLGESIRNLVLSLRWHKEQADVDQNASEVSTDEIGPDQ